LQWCRVFFGNTFYILVWVSQLHVCRKLRRPRRIAADFCFIGTYLFFHERVTFRHIFGGAIAITGSVMISWGDFQLSGMALWGDLMAILGAVLVTAYFLFGQSARKRLSLMTYTYIVYSIAVLVLLAYDVALQYPLLSYPGKDWLLFLALALFPTLLGHTLFNWVIKWVSTSVVSMSILGEPIAGVDPGVFSSR
jgi:drug/metabolite transporter (DMT)-like permease